MTPHGEMSAWKGPLFMALIALLGLFLSLVHPPQGALSARSEGPEAEGSVTVAVECPQEEGCFLLLGRALREAPEGAVIRLGPGLYYEKPMVVPKSLTIEGAGLKRTEIRIVDPGAAFTLKGAETTPIAFTLKALTVRTHVLAPRIEDSGQNVGVLWESARGGGEDGHAPFTITIQNARIEGGTGLVVNGRNGSVRLLRSKILTTVGNGLAIEGGNLQVSVEDSVIAGPSSPLGLDPLLGGWFGVAFFSKIKGEEIQASIKGSGIFDWGLAGIAARGFGDGRVKLRIEDSELKLNRSGLVLGGSVEATITANEVAFNKDYGIALLLPPCSFEGQLPSGEELFKGTIRGRDNRVYSNGQSDLCPEEFNWPPNFVYEPPGARSR